LIGYVKFFVGPLHKRTVLPDYECVFLLRYPRTDVLTLTISSKDRYNLLTPNIFFVIAEYIFPATSQGSVGSGLVIRTTNWIDCGRVFVILDLASMYYKFSLSSFAGGRFLREDHTPAVPRDRLK